MTQWICSQIGAREHYAVPRALYNIDRLRTLYTEFWADALVRKIKIGKLRSLATRFHPDLATANIQSWNLRALAWEAGLRRRSNRGGIHDKYFGFIDVGRKFACAVRDHLRRHPDSLRDTLFYGYDTGALETLQWLREQGIPCVLNQMDPNRVEVNLMREEEKRWPGWVLASTEVPEEYFHRREQEWALANRVVVNSEFCRLGLIQQGVPAEKIVVIPLCYESDHAKPAVQDAPNISSQRPLRLLFLGQVILRKGIQYLIEAAKLLRTEPVHFDVVGPISLSEAAIKSAPSNMTFHGRATRDQVGSWYQQSDIFVLPTLSDGFAVTQIEAMAYGLPVIATPSCGEIVTDGIDGFIVTPRQPEMLVKTITRYLAEPGLLPAQRVAALRKSSQFKLDQLTARLSSLEETLLPH
jgi:glycosyltransferase involved in cell wall biosynthesis